MSKLINKSTLRGYLNLAQMIESAGDYVPEEFGKICEAYDELVGCNEILISCLQKALLFSQLSDNDWDKETEKDWVNIYEKSKSLIFYLEKHLK